MTDGVDDWRLIEQENSDRRRIRNRDEVEMLMSRDSFDRDEIMKVSVADREVEGEWLERGSNNLAGRILTADIDFENELIYCISDGGNIWRGSIEGEGWTSLNDGFQIRGAVMIRAMSYGSGTRVVVASGNGIYYTDNDGIVMEKSAGLEFLDSWGSIKRAVASDSGDLIYALLNEWDPVDSRAESSIYVSTDFGSTFDRAISFDQSEGFVQIEDADHFDIWMSRYFDGPLYVMNDIDLYTYDGSSIDYISSAPGSYSGAVALTGGTESSVFLYAYSGGRIFHSINSGQSWIDKGDSPSTWWWINGFSTSNLIRENVYIGGMEVYESSNSGGSWAKVNNWWDYYSDPGGMLHADIPEIRFFLDQEYNEVALISTDGGLYFSDSYMDEVSNISLSGLGVSQYYSTYTTRYQPYHIYAGSQDQGFQKSLEDSHSGIRDFEQSISGDYGHLSSGDDGATIWANYPGFTIFFPNLTQSNQSISLDFPTSGHLWLAPLIADYTDPDIAYLGGGGVSGGHHIIKLTRFGSSLSYEELPFSFSNSVSAMAISPLDYSRWYVLTSGGQFYRSTDAGETWALTFYGGPDGHYFYGSTILPSKVDPDVVYIGGSGYSSPPVYMSTNNGQSFSRMDEGLPNTLVYKLDSTEDSYLLFAATEAGPYVYVDHEGQWYDIAGLGAPDQTYWSLEYIPELLTARVGTYGRGIWDFVLSDDYNVLYGDLNNDTIINIQDIIVMINYAISNGYIVQGDLNDDGPVNIQDIVLLVNIVLGN